jgi:hypothetical protein
MSFFDRVFNLGRGMIKTQGSSQTERLSEQALEEELSRMKTRANRSSDRDVSADRVGISSTSVVPLSARPSIGESADRDLPDGDAPWNDPGSRPPVRRTL